MAAERGHPIHRQAGGCGCRACADAAGHRRLVSYSLVCDVARRAEHAGQFELSLASLRAFSPYIAVVLFVHGGLAPEMADLCRRFNVMVRGQGDYCERLAALLPHGGAAMARYPVLHKQLNFAELAAAGAQQVLCCDLDTVFFADVERLFDRYAEPHVVAREEVYSARSVHGSDLHFIDEPLLARLAGSLGRASVAPINLGVVLYNHGVVARLAALMPTFLDDTWRLMTGLLRPSPGSSAAAADPASFAWLADVQREAGEADLRRALPFPSSNGWIVEEVAWWLTLGSLPDLLHADFSPHDVAQNGEVLFTPRAAAPWTMCHYYSHNLERVIEWLSLDSGPATRSSTTRAPQGRAAPPAAIHER